jgi:hypothetical protein
MKMSRMANSKNKTNQASKSDNNIYYNDKQHEKRSTFKLKYNDSALGKIRKNEHLYSEKNKRQFLKKKSN